MFDESVKCVAPHVASDWERRMTAGFADLAGSNADRIEAALAFWMEDGAASLGRAVSWCRVVRRAVDALGPDTSPAAQRLRRMGVFAEGLLRHGPRIHLSYHDRLHAAGEGRTPSLRAEIEAEAVRIGKGDGFVSDPAEAYHAALLTWLVGQGHECAPRKLMRASDVLRLHDAILMRGPRPRGLARMKKGARRRPSRSGDLVQQL